MVITKGFDPLDPSSILGRSFKVLINIYYILICTLKNKITNLPTYSKIYNYLFIDDKPVGSKL